MVEVKCSNFTVYRGTSYETMQKSILSKEGFELPEDCLDLVVKESQGQVRDLLKLLQISAEKKLNTADKLSKFLALPDITGMGAFLAGVLSGNSKLATKALRSVNTDLLEWRNRLETLIYEILEDKYEISELAYSISQNQKLRELANSNTTSDFGKVLDYLLKIYRAETAFQMLYVLATLGVEQC